MKPIPKTMTPLEALRDSLIGAGRYNPDDVVAPVPILWTDPDRQWEGIIPRLQAFMPEFQVLGEYGPARRTGPAIWLRCIEASDCIVCNDQFLVTQALIRW